MGGVYKIVRPDGSIEYTDTPAGNGNISSVGQGRNGSATKSQSQQSSDDYQRAKTLMKEAQKRIPKIVDYLDYLEYLRHNSPVRFNRVMEELRAADPATWMKLQKYPQFRPLKETVVGLKAGQTMMGAGIAAIKGDITGGAEKVFESTLKDLMKRDRFGPYADVLGSKASTLPSKEVTYSNSRLGQYLKAEDAAAAKAAAASAKGMATADAALRAAKATAVTRAMGPLVDLGISALNPETANSVGIIVMRKKLDTLAQRNPEIDIDTENYAHARMLLSQGKYAEFNQFVDRFK